MATIRDFSEQDWAHITESWSAWWAGELERPIVYVEALDPGAGTDWTTYDDHLSQFGLDTPVETILDHVQKRLDGCHWFGDAFPKWWVNYGPGIMAGFLGGGVEHTPGTTWFGTLDAPNLGAMTFSFHESRPWWRRIQAVTAGGIKRWGGEVVTGFTDIGGNLDVLASLRGTQELLFDLYDDPDNVGRLSQQITKFWLQYYDEQVKLILPVGRGSSPWAPIWAPGPTYMLQSDFCYMISPAMFERYVLPDLTACCDAIPYAFYHMDGKGQIPHLDMLLSIKSLKGIQWQPGDGQPMSGHSKEDGWLPLLARIRDGGKLCQVFCTRQGARTIMDNLGGRGFVLAITESITPQEGREFMEALKQDYGVS